MRIGGEGRVKKVYDCGIINLSIQIMMNHVIEINKNRYLIRQYLQKIEVLTFPYFHLVQKHYINASSSYLNRDTR